jgi:hypothetical protein
MIGPSVLLYYNIIGPSVFLYNMYNIIGPTVAITSLHALDGHVMLIAPASNTLPGRPFTIHVLPIVQVTDMFASRSSRVPGTIDDGIFR